MSGEATAATARGLHRGAGMFVFFSNRLGCLGSLLVSAVLSIVLILALRSCGGAAVTP